MAASAAALLFAVQLIAAAHVHPWAWTDSLSRAAQLSPSDTACPVCLVHAHAPISTTNAPVLVRPLLVQRLFAAVMISRLLCAPKPQLFGRAPPASI